MKEKSEKASLKLHFQKTKIMASGPITPWQIDEETMETETDFIFLGSKITADSDCSHEMKRRLLLGRKAMTYLDSILKSRDITLPTKVPLVKAMVFPVVIYRCESWTIKKAEHQRIGAFELLEEWTRVELVLEKTIESPLDCKETQPVHPKGNKSWIFMGRTDAEAEAPILWPPDAKSWLIWKDLDAGKECRREEKGTTEHEMVEWHHRLNERVWVSSGSWWWTGKPGVLHSMGSQRVGHDWVTELTTITIQWYDKDCALCTSSDLIFGTNMGVRGTLLKPILQFRKLRLSEVNLFI